MRIVIVLLLLANVTLYLYTRLDTGGGEAVLLQDQVQPDKIKLLTPQQVAALGPAKVAALNDVCVEWGPFSEVDRTRALSDIEPLALGRLVSQKKVDFDNGYWVNMGPFATRPAAENRVASTRFSASACDDTSIAAARQPLEIICRNMRCTSGASGVVRVAS